MKGLGVLFSLLVIISLSLWMVDFARFPDSYLSTWRYQLENDLKQGDEEAIEYYNERYVENGRFLYGDKYIK